MDDLDLIESKARSAIDESKDIDTLAKATQVLRDVNEQRKMRAERSSETGRFWIATLVPTLAVLVTGFALFWQIQQGKMTAQTEEDAQWRSALEKIELDPKSAHVGALEMESFFSVPNTNRQTVAHIVAASLLGKVDDPGIFQAVFDAFGTHQQRDLILLAKTLTLRLRHSYGDHSSVLNQEGCHPNQSSLKLFLSKPECFYANNDPAQDQEIEEVDLAEAELDSVIKALIYLEKNKSGPTLANQDLENIVFYTSDTVDYSGLDFSGSQLDGSGFYGQCKVGDAKIDAEYRSTVDRCNP